MPSRPSYGLVLITYPPKHPLNAHDDTTSRTRGLNFGLSLFLYPYFVYAIREGSGETEHMHSLI